MNTDSVATVCTIGVVYIIGVGSKSSSALERDFQYHKSGCLLICLLFSLNFSFHHFSFDVLLFSQQYLITISRSGSFTRENTQLVLFMFEVIPGGINPSSEVVNRLYYYYYYYQVTSVELLIKNDV